MIFIVASGSEFSAFLLQKDNLCSFGFFPEARLASDPAQLSRPLGQE
jgi:hypothetical protein